MPKASQEKFPIALTPVDNPRTATREALRSARFHAVAAGVVHPKNPLAERIARQLHLMQGLRACDQVLDWLIANKKTGDAFVTFVAEHQWAFFNWTGEVLSKIHGVRGYKVLAGRDYVDF